MSPQYRITGYMRHHSTSPRHCVTAMPNHRRNASPHDRVTVIPMQVSPHHKVTVLPHIYASPRYRVTALPLYMPSLGNSLFHYTTTLPVANKKLCFQRSSSVYTHTSSVSWPTFCVLLDIPLCLLQNLYLKDCMIPYLSLGYVLNYYWWVQPAAYLALLRWSMSGG